MGLNTSIESSEETNAEPAGRFTAELVEIWASQRPSLGSSGLLRSCSSEASASISCFVGLLSRTSFSADHNWLPKQGMI